MRIKILGDNYSPAVQEDADLVLAPLLIEKIFAEQINEPLFGTQIFHPSSFPHGRGASAIRRAYRRKEPIIATTCFWANYKPDAGDICEQEIVKIDYDLRLCEFYEKHIIPAMLRTLEHCLNDVEKGFKRRIKQVEEYASYDGRIE